MARRWPACATGRCSTSGCGHRPRRARPGGARSRRDRHRLGPRAGRRAARAGARAEAAASRRRAPTRARSTSAATFALVISPMQVVQLLGGAGRPRAGCSPRCAATSSPAALFAAALAEPVRRLVRRGVAAAAARRARGGRLGLLVHADRRPAQRADAFVIERNRQAVSPDRRDSPRSDRRSSWTPSTAAMLEAEAAERRLRAPPPAPGRRPRRTTWAATSCCWRPYERPARLLALPRADEHLRRPRQHRGAARALRVARASASSWARPSMREAVDPGRVGPLLHGRRPGPRPGGRRGGHGRDEARCAARRRRRAAPSCWPCAAATSCSATATRWATRSCRASAWSTCAPCARRGRG